MHHHHAQRKAQQQRDDLTGEHAVGDAGQAVLACLFAATWITDTFFFQYSTFLNQYVPLGVKIPLGVVLLVLSGYLAKTGLSIVFGEERKKPGVIRKSTSRSTKKGCCLSALARSMSCTCGKYQCGSHGFGKDERDRLMKTTRR
jgi:hypothetical protein